MPAVTGCGLLAFEPSLVVEPESGGSSFTTSAGEPVGLHVRLGLPQADGPEQVATPEVKAVTVALPIGMVVSPSSANGLAACSDAQFGLGSAGAGLCPPASQVGTMKVTTPLLARPLEGDVYLAEPRCGPCSPGDAQSGRMVRLFVQATSEGEAGSSLSSKVPRRSTSRLGRSPRRSENNPQLPFNDFKMSLAGGPRATLANPSVCGAATTSADLTPWSTPFTLDSAPTSTFEVTGCLAPQFPVVHGGHDEQPGGRVQSVHGFAFGRSDSDQDLARYPDAASSGPARDGLLGPAVREPQAVAGHVWRRRA